MKKTTSFSLIILASFVVGNCCLGTGKQLKNSRQEKIAKIFELKKVDSECLKDNGLDFVSNDMDPNAFSSLLDDHFIKKIEEKNDFDPLIFYLQSSSFGMWPCQDSYSFLYHHDITKTEADLLQKCLIKSSKESNK